MLNPEKKDAGLKPGATRTKSARVALLAVRAYQASLAQFFGGSCRFQPSCSQYAYEAIARFGAGRGSWLALRRLLRCHPFSGQFGFDAVPERGERKDAGPFVPQDKLKPGATTACHAASEVRW